MDFFPDKIERVDDRRKSSARPRLSVVIVYYDRPVALQECADSLRRQELKEFELLLVDNGRTPPDLDSLSDFDVVYIKCRDNYGWSLGRNIAAPHARADIVAFLDDDALAHPRWTRAHVEAYREQDIFGLRGRLWPRHEAIYNRMGERYDLGEEVVTSYLDLEGNSSMKKDVFLEMGGFNPELWRGEGYELTYRIVKKYGDRNKLVYHPGPIIYHDYAGSLFGYLRKCFRVARAMRVAERESPELLEFIKGYTFPAPRNAAKMSIMEKIKKRVVMRLGNTAAFLSRIPVRVSRG